MTPTSRRPRITPRLCESSVLDGAPDCPRVSAVEAHVDGVPISLCPACARHHAAALDALPTHLDLAQPAYHLRALARGLAPVTDPRRAAALGIRVGELAPVLTLTEAARLLGLRGPQGVQTAERREAGKGVGPGPGGMTLASLWARAHAYGLEVRVVVSRRPR